MKIKAKPSPAIDSLKNYPNWVCWTDGKVPVNPKTGQFAKSSDPSTWGTYDQAKQRYKKGGVHGLGFMFDKNAGIVGVDLDNKPLAVFDEDGELCDWASEIVNSLNSYTEVSPSGNGLHILCIGEIPSSIGSSDQHGVEMYDKRRFFTVTGRHLPNTPHTINDSQSTLESLHAKYKPKHQQKSTENITINTSSNYGNYGKRAIENAMERVSTTGEGGRNNALFTEACSLLELANGGVMDKSSVENAMTAAGINAGLSEHEVSRTIQSAVRKVGNNFRQPKKHHTPQPPVEDTVIITRKELERIKDAEYWRGYHDGMTDAQRQQWVNAGVPEVFINEWGLGYSNGTVDQSTGEVIRDEALTVPLFDSAGILQNVEYRTLSGDIDYKVNFPTLFNPLRVNKGGTLLLIPDNIEAVKVMLHVGTIDIGGQRITIMGLPQNRINEQMVSDTKHFDSVHVLLGSDTPTKGRNLGAFRNRARFTRLPCSITDAMTIMSENDIKRTLSSGQMA